MQSQGASGVNLRERNWCPQRAIVGGSVFTSHAIMRWLSSIRIRCLLLGVLAALLLLPACGRGRHRVLEVAYVSAPQAALRDQVAAIYNRIGNVKNGERVEVLDHEKRFARVRTASGIEGWVEQRFLVDQKTFDGLQKLTQDHKNDPAQAPGVMRNETNLHITPGRDTEHLYQLAAGAKVAVLQRAVSDKQGGPAPVTRPVATKPGTTKSGATKSGATKSGATKSGATTLGAKTAAGPVLEDWWLVRDDQGRIGWVLSRMVDIDAPLEIAQYAEGQRLVAFFPLNEVADGDRKVRQYLCLLTEPHDGQPYDYDQARVFTWNVRKHRYETAYRERNLNGVLPVTNTSENFEKEGVLPVFVLRVKDDAGAVIDRKYKLNTPIVRRVLAPGETPSRAAKRR